MQAVHTGADEGEAGRRFRSFVFIMPDDELDDIFGALKVRAGAHEFLCQGHNCAEATSALYLSPAELDDAARLHAGLLQTLGLERPGR